jgi:hypothetical protein
LKEESGFGPIRVYLFLSGTGYGTLPSSLPGFHRIG